MDHRILRVEMERIKGGNGVSEGKVWIGRIEVELKTAGENVICQGSFMKQ